MAAITAAMVKELREASGAGMMECKKALTETDGDMDAAIEVLKKSGAMKAAKKASRIAAEGLCDVAKCACGKKAAVVEVNSETDFVAKNEKFKDFVGRVAAQALESDAKDMEAFLGEKWIDDESKTVKEALNDMVLTIGEKLDIRRFKKVASEVGIVESYIHGGGKIAVIVEAAAEDKPEIREAMKNIAMQVAAMNPSYVKSSDISAAELDKIREITVDSSLNDPATLPKPIQQKLFDKAIADGKFSEEDLKAYEENKNNKYLFNFLSQEAKECLAGLAMAAKEDYVGDKIFAGLVDGRVKKQLKEITLFEQVYVKAEDGKQTVAQYVDQVAKAAGGFDISSVVRFETGEGIEKREENFAEEVAKQMQ